ncbi:hypothetical protein AB0E08_08295 [Streptomyces sp. NPDC048281]|uniref:hypothetical protein n=1 Tax=Streptomyces sp. NPDC048281 TaxID=3154715 RepID=UPI00343B5BA7
MPPRRKKPPARTAVRLPVWPERACRDLVAGEFANHSCDVVEGHLGPHASLAVPASVAARLRWESANPTKLEPTPEADPFVGAA